MIDPIKSYCAYVAGVLDGSILACKLQRQAVDRHIADLKRAEDGWEYQLDWSEITALQSYAGLCKHQKGEKAGQPVVFEGWQLFVFGSVFAWKSINTGLRRFRVVYIELPRKNGKSISLAIVGLKGLIGDNEAGAEIYSAATKREQAREIFDVARAMVNGSPALKKHILPLKHNLSVKSSMGKFEPLGRDADTMDGKNPHFALVDEFHAHPSRETYEVLETGMGARSQPIMWVITTAGFNLAGPCKQMHDVISALLDPLSPVKNESMFGFIASVDKGDDPFSEKTWAKANPNYGVSVRPDAMRQAAENAKMMPSELNSFLTKRLNVWVGQAERWLPMDKWAQGDAAPQPINGRRLFVGADLATTTDLCALVAVAEDDQGVLDVYCRFWAPRERAELRSKRDMVPYLAWAEQGFLTLHDGAAIDYDQMREEFLETAAEWGFGEIGFDPFNATQLAGQLRAEGMDTVEVRQGYMSLNEPSKELERRVVTGRIRHGNNPVLTWCASNVAIESDPAGNIKPSKKKSNERIDGIAALVNALARFMIYEEKPTESIYEKQGIRSL